MVKPVVIHNFGIVISCAQGEAEAFRQQPFQLHFATVDFRLAGIDACTECTSERYALLDVFPVNVKQGRIEAHPAIRKGGLVTQLVTGEVIGIIE